MKAAAAEEKQKGAAYYRNEPGRLVRVEFVTMPPAIVHGDEPRGPLERGGFFVVLFFTDGMTPPVVRTYQPGRGD